MSILKIRDCTSNGIHYDVSFTPQLVSPAFYGATHGCNLQYIFLYWGNGSILNRGKYQSIKLYSICDK